MTHDENTFLTGVIWSLIALGLGIWAAVAIRKSDEQAEIDKYSE